MAGCIDDDARPLTYLLLVPPYGIKRGACLLLLTIRNDTHHSKQLLKPSERASFIKVFFVISNASMLV